MVAEHRQGHAEVVLECHDTCSDTEYGNAEVVTMKHSYPLKVLVPKYTGNPCCKWIYPIVFGGGLVGGDQVEISVETRPNTCALLTSQESTKVYHCEDNKITRQSLNYTLKEDSMLCVIPDFCVCYRDANFVQTQKVVMSQASDLVLVDWLTSGRSALDENWNFTRYKNSIEIEVEGETILKDSSHLKDVPGLTVQQSMREYKVMGTCIVLGRKLKNLTNDLYKMYSKPRKYGESVDKDVICTVSMIQKKNMSGIYLRFLAIDTSKAYTVLKEIVNPLIPTLGADPFHNKYR